MPEGTNQVISFGGGANAFAAPHLVGESEVVTASNIDFSLEPGAAVSRRGSIKFPVSTYTVDGGASASVGTAAIQRVYRHYQNSIGTSPFYLANENGVVYRMTPAGTAVTLTTGSLSPIGLNSYRNHVHIAGQVNRVKDDGTTTTEWIKQSPAAPTVTVTTLTAINPVGTWTLVEGTGTLTTNTGTVVTDSATHRAIVQAVGTFNLNTNAGSVVGDFGMHSIALTFSDPSSITKVTQSYRSSAGLIFVASAELAAPATEGQASGDSLIEGQLNVGTSTDTSVSLAVREEMAASVREPQAISNGIYSIAPAEAITWVVPRTEFELHGVNAGTGGANPWENISEITITVEGNALSTITIQNPQVFGAENYALTDLEQGYAWWQTFATIDSSGFKIGESAPSPASARTRMANSRAVVVLGTSPSGTISGVTHRVLYRQGGYLRDAYAVATFSVSTATFTDTMNDIQALSLNQKMLRDIYNASNFPVNVVAMGEPYVDRIFIGETNRIHWSLPGLPDCFPKASVATISHAGDEIRALIPWNPSLVIVNRDSVYELQGNIFEGNAQDWTLQRTGSRHGSKAPNVCIKTPYGIPLLNTDGLFMYLPGQGVDQEISWLMAKIGDAWKGTGATDPVALKGNRVPALNLGNLHRASAAFGDNKLYLAVTVGANTYPDTLFVIDFRNQQVWWYNYFLTITSLFWDHEASRLLAGCGNGAVMQLETGLVDTFQDNGNTTGIAWSLRTRLWTTPSDTILENIAIEGKGSNITYMISDQTNTTTIGTYTGTTKDWFIPPLNGTIANNVYFDIIGGGSGVQANLYQIQFDALVEPKRIRFYRTEHTVHQTEQQWDLFNSDIEIIGTGTVLSTVFIDNTAVTTQTMTGPTNGRVVFKTSFPADTTGDVAVATYTASSTAVTFKLWKDYFHTRPEPPRVSIYKSDVKSGNEFWWRSFECDINPLGTVLATVFVDNTAVTTATFTGTKRQSYVHSMPADTYGRTIYALYNTSARFKHYTTWFEGLEEPDRLARFHTFHSEPLSDNEKWWRTFECDVNPLGTVTASVFVDNTLTLTTSFVGTSRQSYVISLPIETYGRTIYALYNTTSIFKHYKTWFEGTDEPDRLLRHHTFRAEPMEGNEKWWKTFECEINALGTVTASVFVDNVIVSTTSIVGLNRQSYVHTLPIEQYGRTIYAVYNASSPFKVYKTWFEGLEEPDRLARFHTFRSEPQEGNEHWWRTLECEINPMGTVTATIYVDHVVTDTATFTGTARQSYVHTLPLDIYGRTIHAIYNTTSVFKHYATRFEGEPEPDRLSFAQHGPNPYPTGQNLKTWLAELNPLGTCTGILYADNAPLSTATFTGTYRKVFQVGLDVSSAVALQTATTVHVDYFAVGSGNKIKHYSTQLETEPKPFGKTTWAITYKKIGGASQLDLARFWEIDVEPVAGATATLTSTWDIDGTAFHTNTLTFTGRTWRDRIPLPPGGRGYLFQQRIISSVPVQVYRSGLDCMRVGVKGLSRVTVRGEPQG